MVLLFAALRSADRQRAHAFVIRKLTQVAQRGVIGLMDSNLDTAVSVTDDGMRPFQITTPIYYVNDKPHIGHAYTSIGSSWGFYFILFPLIQYIGELWLSSNLTTLSFISHLDAFPLPSM